MKFLLFAFSVAGMPVYRGSLISYSPTAYDELSSLSVETNKADCTPFSFSKKEDFSTHLDLVSSLLDSTFNSFEKETNQIDFSSDSKLFFENLFERNAEDEKVCFDIEELLRLLDIASEIDQMLSAIEIQLNRAGAATDDVAELWNYFNIKKSVEFIQSDKCQIQ
eukprot:GHVP01005140.1.p2 GENE.GHVP01005140.1~~GHVP01005140.1.p2  ORF type:complete len:165 (+),score=34.71 GHVP01005140.1:1596-2090(+)